MASPIYKRRLHDRNIRLIQVSPANIGDQLECRLIEISLNDSPVFRALSYVWGDPTSTETILCDGVPLNITVNLAAALRRLREDTAIDSSVNQGPNRNSFDSNHQNAISDNVRSASGSLVWADAICINQQDIDERGHQVQLMKDIYSIAFEVIAWLGDAYDLEMEKAIQTMEYVHNEVLGGIRESTHGEEISLEKRRALTYATLQTWLSPQEWDPWASLRQFFGNPWWDRIWCVQEVRLAHKVIVLLGPRKITVDAISSFTKWNFDQGWNTVSGYIDTEKARVRFHGLSNMRALIDILNSYRNLQATDPRDKVYGLLGLVEGPSLKVDYTKSVKDIYIDVVKLVLQYDCTLEVLSCVEHQERVDQHAAFPSWIPRWDQVQNTSFLWSNGSPMSAGLDLTRFTGQTLPAIASGILQLNGVPFDTVAKVGHPIDVNILDVEEDTIFQGICLDLAGVMRGYVSALGYPDAPQLRGSAHSIRENVPRAAQDFVVNAIIFTRMLIYYTAPFGHHDTAEEQARATFRLFWALCMHRRLFRTSKGFLGLGPKCMRPGDQVVVFNGGKVPYILTPRDESKDEHKFLGECYVHSIMNGEAYDMWRPKQDVVFKIA